MAGQNVENQSASVQGQHILRVPPIPSNLLPSPRPCPPKFIELPQTYPPAGVKCSIHEPVENISDSTHNRHFCSCERHMGNNGLREETLLLAHNCRCISPWPLDSISGKAERVSWWQSIWQAIVYLMATEKQEVEDTPPPAFVLYGLLPIGWYCPHSWRVSPDFMYHLPPTFINTLSNISQIMIS